MTKLMITTKKDEHYTLFSAGDIFGGFNNNSRLVINFTTDTPSLPSIIVHDIVDNKLTNEQHIYDPSEKDIVHMNRIIHGTVVLSPEVTADVSVWMLRQLMSNPYLDFDKAALKNKVEQIFESPTVNIKTTKNVSKKSTSKSKKVRK